MRTPARPASMHSRTRRRTAMMPPCPVSPSRITGNSTDCAIHLPICTHSVIDAVPTSARPVYPPTTAEVPTKPASQPACSITRASAAVGGWSTERTRPLRARRSRRRRDLLEATARVEAHGVVPEKLALPLLRHVPGEHLLHGFREVALAVRVVGGIHQHFFADEVDHRVGKLFAFWNLDALEVAAARDVFARLRLQLRGRGGDGLGMLVDARHPERQPAVASFERGKAKARIAVHHASADHRRHVAHAAPGMRGRALQPQVLPRIEAAGRVRRHHGERMQHYRKIVVLRRRPYRLEARVIDRHAVRRVGHHRPGPARFAPALDLLQARLHVARADDDDAAQALGIRAAVLVHPAVVRAIHRHLQRDVVASGPGAEPARGQRQIHVDTLEVEVLDALGRIVVAALGRLAAALGAGKARHVGALVGRGFSGAELSQVAALALGVDGVALALRLECFPTGQARFLVGREVALEHIHVGADVRVGIEDLETVSHEAILVGYTSAMRRAFAVVLLVVSQFALAQYPEKPIRLIVGLAPGGATDIMARTLVPPSSEELGQPVVVDNRPGAAGSIGALAGAKAAPDGYTLFLASSSFTSNLGLQQSASYDPIPDFEPITNVASGPFLLVVRTSLPVKSVAELIAYAKANPGKLNYASSGIGSTAHLTGELLKRAAGIEMTHIVYRGAGPALADVLAGQVDLMFARIVSSVHHARTGNVRALAVTSLKRSSAVPEFPTVGESVPGFEMVGYFGLLAPAHTPAPIISKVHAAVVRAIQRRDFIERVAADGAEPDGCSPAELRALLEHDMKKLGDLAQAAHIPKQ